MFFLNGYSATYGKTFNLIKTGVIMPEMDMLINITRSLRVYRAVFKPLDLNPLRSVVAELMADLTCGGVLCRLWA